MKFERFDIYDAKLKEQIETFKTIGKCKDNHEKLEKLKNIIKECNIMESINIEYLKVVKEINEEEFQKELKYYEPTLSKETFEREFPNVQTKKVSTVDKIKFLIADVMSLNNLESTFKYERLKSLMRKLREEMNNKFEINFQTLPLDNIELSLDSIYRVCCQNLYGLIEQLSYFHSTDNYREENDKKYDIDKVSEIEKLTSKIRISDGSQEKIKESITENTEDLISFRISRNSKFKHYLRDLNYFFFEVKDNYDARFKEGIKTLEDLKLYEKFVFFLTSFNFFELDKNYIDVWKESFKSMSLNELKKKIEEKNNELKEYKNKKIVLDKNEKDLVLEFKGETFRIENIEKYSYVGLLNFLHQKVNSCPIDYFSLIPFVKIQYLDSFIHKYILTEEWKKFYYDVFKSNTIDSLIKSTYKEGYKIDKNIYDKIIDSVSFFDFYTNFYGETFAFVTLFISSRMNLKGNSNKEKIKYYIHMFLTFLHEILGHSLVIILRNLYDPSLLSPTTIGKDYSPYANKRMRESGEFIIIKLFGKQILRGNIEYNEIRYMFTIKNYELDYENFKKGFFESKNITTKLGTPNIMIELFKDIKDSDFGKISFDMYYSQRTIQESNIITLFEEDDNICNPFTL